MTPTVGQAGGRGLIRGLSGPFASDPATAVHVGPGIRPARPRVSPSPSDRPAGFAAGPGRPAAGAGMTPAAGPDRPDPGGTAEDGSQAETGA
jgi:hypothetical protein